MILGLCIGYVMFGVAFLAGYFLRPRLGGLSWPNLRSFIAEKPAKPPNSPSQSSAERLETKKTDKYPTF